MELLNKNGNILMDYRREFKRHYATSIDEALKEAVYKLYKDGQIPEKLFRIILDESVDDGDVYSYLVSKREFTKSSMELNSEFDQVREKVNEYLIKIGFTKNVCTKNSINTNRIYVIRQYDITKELLMKFFGLSPTEIIPLMRRKGFMDKFCVLRLSQVFKEIYASLRAPEHLDHGYDKIFYNKSTQGFSIDYKYKVNINYIMDEERLKDIMNRIKELDAIVEKQFSQKMNSAYFKSVYDELKSEDFQAQVEKIEIPVRSGKRSADIRKPEWIIEEVREQEKEQEAVDLPIILPGTESIASPSNVEKADKKATSPEPQKNVQSSETKSIEHPPKRLPEKSIEKTDKQKPTPPDGTIANQGKKASNEKHQGKHQPQEESREEKNVPSSSNKQENRKVPDLTNKPKNISRNNTFSENQKAGETTPKVSSPAPQKKSEITSEVSGAKQTIDKKPADNFDDDDVLNKANRKEDSPPTSPLIDKIPSSLVLSDADSDLI